MRYGEFFSEDNEECIVGVFSTESKESIMGISRGEREQRVSGTRPGVLIATACLHIRAVRAAEHRGRVGLARVKGRRGQEEKGEQLMAVIIASRHAFSDGLDKLNCFLGMFRMVFLLSGEDRYDKECELLVSLIIFSLQSWNFHTRES